MFVEFIEYRLGANKQDRHLMLIQDEVVYVNTIVCKNREKIDEIKQLCLDRFDQAIKLGLDTNHKQSDEIQRKFTMKFIGVKVSLDASGTNQDIRAFYNKLKADVENILYNKAPSEK
jgi:hypothetical protein